MPAAKQGRVATKKARRKPPRRTRTARGIARLERELPPTLAQFSRRVRTRLGQVEKRIHGAEVRTRRSFTRVLRQASHQLGRFEAKGEREWRKLTTQARKDAVKVLRGLERVLEPPAKPARKKSTASKKSRQAARKKAGSEASGSGI